jgi:hypothetical protein
MSDTPGVITRADIEEVILTKVVEDPAFAARLKADPKAALREAFETELPDELQITVFQESANHLMIRIPLMITDEVSESELEGVAGGACTPFAKIKVGKLIAKAVSAGVSGGIKFGINYGVTPRSQRPY